MPLPAEPAPKMTMRCSVSGTPVTLIGRQQRAGGDGGGALDVVVEGAQPVAIALQQAVGIALGEVLPLQQHMRPALGDGLDKGLNEVVVFGARARAHAASRHRAGRRGARALSVPTSRATGRVFAGSMPPQAA